MKQQKNGLIKRGLTMVMGLAIIFAMLWATASVATAAPAADHGTAVLGTEVVSYHVEHSHQIGGSDVLIVILSVMVLGSLTAFYVLRRKRWFDGY